MIRQRITIYNPEDSTDEVFSEIKPEGVKLSGRSYPAEERFIMEQNEIHMPCDMTIQKISFENEGFLFSRYQKGINVYLKPFGSENEVCWEAIESSFNQTLGITKRNFVEAFDSFYYNSNLEHKDITDHYINSQIKENSSIDFSKDFNFEYFYDSTTDKLTLIVSGQTTPEYSIKSDPKFKKELGVFIIDSKISEKDDIVLSGVRIVLDSAVGGSQSNDFVHKTLFHTKPRHRKINGNYKSYIRRNGLHPFLVSEIDIEKPEDNDLLDCAAYYYLDLKKDAFIDKYQLPKDFKLAHLYGNTDLELPEYKVDDWGSEFLMEISPSEPIEMPLHSRYHAPRDLEKQTEVMLKGPIIFLACDSKDPRVLNSNPFDYRRQGRGNYERFFDEDVVFYHPNTEEGNMSLEIPVALKDNTVFTITNTVIILGIIYILHALLNFSRAKAISKEKKIK